MYSDIIFHLVHILISPIAGEEFKTDISCALVFYLMYCAVNDIKLTVEVIDLIEEVFGTNPAE